MTDIYLHHFAIMAPESVIEDVVKFYGEVLELMPGERPNFSLPGYWLYSGAHPLIHLTANQGRAEGKDGYLHHIALRCHDVDRVIRKLEQRNIPYKRIDQEDVRQTQLIVRDPAGTAVELNFAS